MLQTLRFALLISLLSLTAAATSAQATKCGHMNLGNLIESLPEFGVANQNLKTFADKYSARVDSFALVIETAGKAFEAGYRAGEFTQLIAQQKYAELEKQQQTYQLFEREAEATIGKKRDELVQPIITKVNDAIKAVAKENGYMLVFDTSTGATLFALESEDISSLVRKKLGL